MMFMSLLSGLHVEPWIGFAVVLPQFVAVVIEPLGALLARVPRGCARGGARGGVPLPMFKGGACIAGRQQVKDFNVIFLVILIARLLHLKCKRNWVKDILDAGANLYMFGSLPGSNRLIATRVTQLAFLRLPVATTPLVRLRRVGSGAP